MRPENAAQVMADKREAKQEYILSKEAFQGWKDKTYFLKREIEELEREKAHLLQSFNNQIAEKMDRYPFYFERAHKLYDRACRLRDRIMVPINIVRRFVNKTRNQRMCK